MYIKNVIIFDFQCSWTYVYIYMCLYNSTLFFQSAPDQGNDYFIKLSYRRLLFAVQLLSHVGPFRLDGALNPLPYRQLLPPTVRPILMSLSSWLRRRTGRATGEHRPQLSTGARRIMWFRITSQNSVSTFERRACVRYTRSIVVQDGKHGC